MAVVQNYVVLEVFEVMAKYLKQVTRNERDFWASAYLMAANKVMNRALLEKVDLAGEKYWQKRLDLANEIADYIPDAE